ncbi:hypothetical protein VCUG_00140 [Vavraia culicis subsp. floridensis]|uniref:Uncharacterized protein n=1 Tax=Vavraia culicis (isolate floridensis) TaxID=948595 RepID=L2GXD8_VAVCU|nr:uncharacterized protein VCUG_00140 [Vavraia culicis subsp. floridensis]ELA48304.1 hypothetical protein VCUG_00140 [Vavraia culicis subsp. floridensis]
MSLSCCKKQSRARITLLGPDTKSTNTMYTRLTKSTKERNTHARHLETLTSLNSLKVSLCNVECHDKELWSLNMRFSDGVVFIVDVDEDKLDLERLLKDRMDRHVVLVMCNTRNIGDCVVESAKDWGDRVKVVVCNVEEWKGVDEALRWMTDMLSGKSK